MKGGGVGNRDYEDKEDKYLSSICKRSRLKNSRKHLSGSLVHQVIDLCEEKS